MNETQPLPVVAFPLSSTQRLLGFLRGDRSDNRVQLTRAVYDLLGWGLSYWQATGSEVESLIAVPMAKGDEQLALALDGLMQTHHPVATAQEGKEPATVPPWLLPLVAELLKRILER